MELGGFCGLLALLFRLAPTVVSFVQLVSEPALPALPDVVTQLSQVLVFEVNIG